MELCRRSIAHKDGQDESSSTRTRRLSRACNYIRTERSKKKNEKRKERSQRRVYSDTNTTRKKIRQFHQKRKCLLLQYSSFAVFPVVVMVAVHSIVVIFLYHVLLCVLFSQIIFWVTAKIIDVQERIRMWGKTDASMPLCCSSLLWLPVPVTGKQQYLPSDAVNIHLQLELLYPDQRLLGMEHPSGCELKYGHKC